MKSKILSLFLFTMFSCSSAMADCYYNGERYDEGDRVNGFECRDGRWR